MYVIGDIAGQYDCLMRLVARFTPGEEIICVGDLIDRGPKSKEVVEWAIKTPNVESIMGNHEHMMLDYFEWLPQNSEGDKVYDSGIWLYNGGQTTLNSYGFEDQPYHKVILNPPKEHLNYLASRLPFIEKDDIFITHAAIGSWWDFNDALKVPLHTDYSIIWSRNWPIKRSKFQVFGHNSHWGLRWFSDDGNQWAVCLDASRDQVLTALHWPSKTIIQEPFKPVPERISTTGLTNAEADSFE
jgi:hypothetical protein